MERLTKRDTDGQVMMDCLKCEADWAGNHGKPMVDCTVLYCRKRLKARLAAYEDTGLTPEEVNDAVVGSKLLAKAKVVSVFGVAAERLRELAEAEKAGRVVVLPAKTVYELTWDAGSNCDGICPVSIDGVGCCDFCDTGELCIYEVPCKQEHIERIGDDVFLTYEEAKAALEAMKNG